MTHIKAPSGLSGEIRGVQGSEFNIFTDDQAMRDGRAADRILQTCWIATHDKGPYHFEGDMPKWGDVLVGDRTYILLQISAATFGAEHELDMKCPRCRKKFVWALPVNQLEIRELRDEVREQVDSGKKTFQVELPSTGAKVSFKVMTGADQRKGMKKLSETTNKDAFTAALEHRITEVEGIEGKEIPKWIATLPGGDVQELFYLMDDYDCGVDDEVDVYCPRVDCQFEWTVSVPLDMQEWFAPKRRRRRRDRPVIRPDA